MYRHAYSPLDEPYFGSGPRSNFLVPTWCRVCDLTDEERKEYDMAEKEREANRVGWRGLGRGGDGGGVEEAGAAVTPSREGGGEIGREGKREVIEEGKGEGGSDGTVTMIAVSPVVDDENAKEGMASKTEIEIETVEEVARNMPNDVVCAVGVNNMDEDRDKAMEREDEGEERGDANVGENEIGQHNDEDDDRGGRKVVVEEEEERIGGDDETSDANVQKDEVGREEEEAKDRR